MKVVLAEKPSVAKDIARVLGATSKQNGYLEGNGYQVTWAFGHLISLATPEEYGYKQWKLEELPIIPNNFIYKPNSEGASAKQLSVIRQLFKEATEIICATDAGREGEAIFRYIYNHIGCRKPIKRLWISSLTDIAIKKGFETLKDGSEYENLYNSAKARNEADWMVGLNATRALTLASNSRQPLSIGRVQTPTLALICSRYNEHNNFTPTPYYKCKLMLTFNAKKFTAVYNNDFKTEEEAKQVIASLGQDIELSKKEYKDVTEKAPLPFDLTSLQAEANRKYKYSAQKTLDITQALYEKHKMLTYPRTGSRYLANDMLEEVGNKIARLNVMRLDNNFLDCIRFISEKSVNKAAFDDTKLTDHHAIIPTFHNIDAYKTPSLTQEEKNIYALVCKQTVMALMPPCEKEVTTLSFNHKDGAFISKGVMIKKVGWRLMYEPNEDEEEKEEEQSLPNVNEGDVCIIANKEVVTCMTKKPALLTEASLLKAMETAGRLIDDADLAKAIKDCGLGTPATRAAIIQTLYQREYIRNEKNKLLPTELGLNVYNLTKDKPIASAELTGKWEEKLNRIAEGKFNLSDFYSEIIEFTKEETKRLISEGKSVNTSKLEHPCPICGAALVENNKAWGCSNFGKTCKFVVWKEIGGKKLTLDNLNQIILNGKTELIKGLKSKEGKSFDAHIEYDKEQNKLKYSFAERKAIGKCPICSADVMPGNKHYKCSNKECNFIIWEEISGKKISEAQIKKLLQGQTDVIKGFTSKAGKAFDARLKIEDGKVVFVFEKK